MNHRRWSKWEKDVLARYRHVASAERLADMLPGRSVKAVRRQLDRLGPVGDIKEGLSREEISERTGSSMITVRNWIRGGFLPAKRLNRRIVVDEQAFEAFWAAYYDNGRRLGRSSSQAAENGAPDTGRWADEGECIVAGCEGGMDNLKRGLCGLHASRLHRTGSVEKKEKKSCAIEGCGKVHYARGFCERHYNRWYDQTTGKDHKRRTKTKE